jgi:hypothetical protein
MLWLREMLWTIFLTFLYSFKVDLIFKIII